MAKLIIVGHLERAEALNPGHLFGYTLSIGWSEADRPAIDTRGAHPLLPWSWKTITKIQLFGRVSSNGNWVSIGAFDVIPNPGSADTGNIKTEAIARYGAASSIKWPDPSTDTPITKLPVNQEAEASQSNDPWPAHVVEMSGMAFPVAQQLNLSFVFPAKQDLGTYSAFAAAPVLAKDLDLDAELPPSGFQAPFRSSDGYSVYNQGSGTHPFEILAASNVVTSPALTVPDGQGIAIISAYRADWQQEFLLGASRLFSVPSFIQFILIPPDDRRLDPLRRATPDDIIPTLTAAGVACLRDLISAGREAGPLGGFPDVRQLLAANPAVDREVAASGYRNGFPDMKTWTDFLQANLPGARQLSLWNLVARNDDAGNQAVSDLKRYYGQLRRDFSTILAPIVNEPEPGGSGRLAPPNHKQVMTALWTAILAKLTQAPRAQVDSVRSGLPSALKDSSYASLWMDDTLGMFWKNILDNPTTDENPFLARTRALSRYFLLTRLGQQVTSQETPANLPIIWRDTPTDWKPQGNELTRWNSFKPLLLQWITEWHASVSSAFEPFGGVLPEQNSHNPLPVYVQYYSFDQDKDADNNEVNRAQPDLFRDIRGVGLLVREQNYPQWTCANLNAAVDIRGDQCVQSPVGFPLRSGFIAKLRRGLIAYDSEPLSGGTALDNTDGLQDTLSSTLQARRPLLAADSHPDVLVPQLKYGRNFSFATFSVLNSGIVPAVLRDGGDPRAWRSSCAAIPGTWTTRPQLYQRTTKVGALRILREDAAPGMPAVLPSVPVGTYPRARDIHWGQGWNDFKDPLTPADPEKLNLVLLSPDSWVTPRSSVPKNSYQFRVRLPEVTWREWSTWGASLPGRNSAGLPDPSQPAIPLDPNQFKQHRADIIAECLTSSLDEKAMPAVDDPCLGRLLYVELIEESAGKLILKDSKFVPMGALLGKEGRSLYRAAGARVICRHNGNSGSRLSVDEPAQTITTYVEEGKVAILRVWACLPVEYQRAGVNRSSEAFDKMFATGVLPDEKHPGTTYKGKDYLLVSSYDVLIEAASAELPAPASLFNAFQASLRIRQNDPSVAKVVASLPALAAGATISDSQKFLNIGSVKAQRQSWRWEGRPVPLHPSLLEPLESATADQFADAERAWIWDVYPERPDDESVPILMPVQRSASVPLGIFESLLVSGCRYFESRDGLSAASGPAQPQLDLRGSHFRFSLQVTSRYEPLMTLARVGATKFAHPDLLPGSTEAPPSLAWKSTYVPSRVTNPGVPKLRLLLPLTEAYEREESKSSSLLAVFDDVFYDEAGLGDTLEAEIESIPVEKADPQQSVVQAGKDILLRSGNEDPSLKPYLQGQPPPVKIAFDASHPTTKWSGPVGNFRDFTNRYARFLASSFIIPAPTGPKGEAIDVRGWLASIRFRRAVRTRDYPPAIANLSAFKDYSGFGLLKWGRKSSTSGWTDSYWVQFLGSFSRFDAFDSQDYRIADLIPSIDPDSRVLSLRFNGKAIELLPTSVPNFPDSRRLYAVVTQRVFDFRGQYNQELYVATLQQDKGNRKNWSSTAEVRAAALKKLLDDQSEFRVRIIEASFATAGPNANQQPTDPENLFRDLFQFKRVGTQDIASIPGAPSYSPLDGTGSILRVSEPANSVPSGGQRRDLCEIKEPGK